MKYKASLDSTAKTTTVGVTIVIGLILATQSQTINDGEDMMSSTIIGLLLLGYLFSFLFRPTGYEIKDRLLTIHRPLKDIVINIDRISNFEQLDQAMLTRSIRVLGVGGLFGYFGKYSHSKVGTMNWYATQKTNAIMICLTDHRKIVITPNEPNILSKKLNKLMNKYD